MELTRFKEHLELPKNEQYFLDKFKEYQFKNSIQEHNISVRNWNNLIEKFNNWKFEENSSIIVWFNTELYLMLKTLKQNTNLNIRIFFVTDIKKLKDLENVIYINNITKKTKKLKKIILNFIKKHNMKNFDYGIINPPFDYARDFHKIVKEICDKSLHIDKAEFLFKPDGYKNTITEDSTLTEITYHGNVLFGLSGVNTCDFSFDKTTPSTTYKYSNLETGDSIILDKSINNILSINPSDSNSVNIPKNNLAKYHLRGITDKKDTLANGKYQIIVGNGFRGKEPTIRYINELTSKHMDIYNSWKLTFPWVGNPKTLGVVRIIEPGITIGIGVGALTFNTEKEATRVFNLLNTDEYKKRIELYKVNDVNAQHIFSILQD
tara:strand:+ start:191 stop:1324 length:1134 start_codon:yes stop_codon:yes gene_type:complete